MEEKDIESTCPMGCRPAPTKHSENKAQFLPDMFKECLSKFNNFSDRAIEPWAKKKVTDLWLCP